MFAVILMAVLRWSSFQRVDERSSAPPLLDVVEECRPVKGSTTRQYTDATANSYRELGGHGLDGMEPSISYTLNI